MEEPGTSDRTVMKSHGQIRTFLRVKSGSLPKYADSHRYKQELPRANSCPSHQ